MDKSIIKKNIIELCKERELFYQTTSTSTQINCIYAGFDATAASLQIGNLLCLAFLRLMHKCNIKTIVLLGGATTHIGDPTDKHEARKKLQKEQVRANLANIKKQIINLVPYAQLENNADWLSELSFMDFLNKIALHVSVSTLLKLKMFASRLENSDPLCLMELMYPLMQGYDFLWLYENRGCNAQCGGADQWCNILTGTELIKKKHVNAQGGTEEMTQERAIAISHAIARSQGGTEETTLDKEERSTDAGDRKAISHAIARSQGGTEETTLDKEERSTDAGDRKAISHAIARSIEPIGITFPLLAGKDGKKLGKSLAGAVYIDPDQYPIYDFWQFWRNVDDSLVISLLKKLTLIPIAEIEAIKDINQAKIILANDITTWVHGSEDAHKAATNAKAVFVEKDLEKLSEIKCTSNKLSEIMVEVGAASTNAQAKTLIEQCAVKIDDEIVHEKGYIVDKKSFVLAVGKKKFFRILIDILID